MSASAPGVAGRSAVGGAIVVAARQHLLRQQRHRVLSGSVEKPSASHSPARRARRFGFYLPELLALWEQLKLPYVVVAVYCDQEHDFKTVAKLPKPAEKSATIVF